MALIRFWPAWKGGQTDTKATEKVPSLPMLVEPKSISDASRILSPSVSSQTVAVVKALKPAPVTDTTVPVLPLAGLRLRVGACSGDAVPASVGMGTDVPLVTGGQVGPGTGVLVGVGTRVGTGVGLGVTGGALGGYVGVGITY